MKLQCLRQSEEPDLAFLLSRGIFFQAEFDLVDTLVFLNNIKTWGVGGSYVVAKNTLFNVYQSFGSKWKTNKTHADDPEEQTRAEFVFSFYVPRLQKNLKKACALLRAQAFLLMEGGLKLENVRNLGKPESLSRASSGVRIYPVLLEFLAVHQGVGLGQDGVDVFNRCFSCSVG